MTAIGQVWKLTSLDSLSLMRKIHLRGEDLTPEQKERVQEAFSRVLNHEAVSPILKALNSRGASINFDINEKRGFLINGGVAVPFSEFTKWRSPFQALYREIQELDRFAKRKGKGTRTAHLSERDRKIEIVSKRANSERALDPPFQRPKFQEVNAVFLDCNSYFRNVLASAAKVAAIGWLVAGSALVGGTAGFAQGGLIARGARKDAARFYRHGDGEGVAHSLQLAGVGASYSSVSSGMVVNAAATLAGNAAMAATGLSVLIASGFPLQGIIGIYGLYGWQITRNFRLELKAILDEAKEPSEAKRLLEALSWIEDQVGLSEWEVMEIRSKSKTPQEAGQLMEKRLQKKWSQFERRTNVECGEYLRSKLAAFAKVKEGLTIGNSDALQEARKIVYEVEQANYKERVKYKCLFLIAIIGMVGFILTVFFPPFAVVLFALGAILWLSVDSSHLKKAVGDAAWFSYLEKRKAAKLAVGVSSSERSSAA